MLYLTKTQREFAKIIRGRLTNSPDILKSINNGIFSVNKLSLSYRQVNELSKAKMIKDNRIKTKKGWRKFNIKEAIYLNTISKLKGAGLTNKQLSGFKKSFYKGDEFEKALYLTFSGENIILSIDEKGNADYYDWLYFVVSYKKMVKVNFNVSISLYKVAEEFFDQKPETLLFKKVIYDFFNKIKDELKDYPDETGMTEEQVKKLVEQLYELSDVLFERWLSDKNKK